YAVRKQSRRPAFHLFVPLTNGLRGTEVVAEQQRVPLIEALELTDVDVRGPFPLRLTHVQLPQLWVRLRHRPKLVVDELGASSKSHIAERNRQVISAVEIDDGHLQVDNVLRRKPWH